MEPIFSMTTLQRNPSLVKAEAKKQIVRITEQKGEPFVFCSEKAFEQLILKEREDAAYEARLLEAVGRGISDIHEGRYVTDINEAFDRADVLRKQHD